MDDILAEYGFKGPMVWVCQKCRYVWREPWVDLSKVPCPCGEKSVWRVEHEPVKKVTEG